MHRPMPKQGSFTRGKGSRAVSEERRRSLPGMGLRRIVRALLDLRPVLTRHSGEAQKGNAGFRDGPGRCLGRSGADADTLYARHHQKSRQCATRLIDSLVDAEFLPRTTGPDPFFVPWPAVGSCAQLVLVAPPGSARNPLGDVVDLFDHEQNQAGSFRKQRLTPPGTANRLGSSRGQRSNALGQRV